MECCGQVASSLKIRNAGRSEIAKAGVPIFASLRHSKNLRQQHVRLQYLQLLRVPIRFNLLPRLCREQANNSTNVFHKLKLVDRILKRMIYSNSIHKARISACYPIPSIQLRTPTSRRFSFKTLNPYQQTLSNLVVSEAKSNHHINHHSQSPATLESVPYHQASHTCKEKKHHKATHLQAGPSFHRPYVEDLLLLNWVCCSCSAFSDPSSC